MLGSRVDEEPPDTHLEPAASDDGRDVKRLPVEPSQWLMEEERTAPWRTAGLRTSPPCERRSARRVVGASEVPSTWENSINPFSTWTLGSGFAHPLT